MKTLWIFKKIRELWILTFSCLFLFASSMSIPLSLHFCSNLSLLISFFFRTGLSTSALFFCSTASPEIGEELFAVFRFWEAIATSSSFLVLKLFFNIGKMAIKNGKQYGVRRPIWLRKDRFKKKKIIIINYLYRNLFFDTTPRLLTLLQKRVHLLERTLLTPRQIEFCRVEPEIFNIR